jgi:ubiquinol-cytochrome c reductase iron-sulfur subunit
MNDTPKRLLLRLSVKIMGLIGAGSAAYALISSVGDHTSKPKSPPVLRLHLPATTEPFSRISWAGGNLILLKRDKALLESLSRMDSELLDPQSGNARQPEVLASPSRSLQSDYFLAYDRGTDMGCPLTWVPSGDISAPHQPWPGGFRDTCRGSWYDAAGRVFKEQQAERNLDIPSYRQIAPDLLEIGGNGDNPASMK